MARNNKVLTSWGRDIAAAVVKWTDFVKQTTLSGEFTAPLLGRDVLGDVVGIEEAGVEL